MRSYVLGKGHWPDELDEDGNVTYPDDETWEDFSLVLFGSEAGDYVEEKSEVDLVLKSLGYKLIKIKKGKK